MRGVPALDMAKPLVYEAIGQDLLHLPRGHCVAASSAVSEIAMCPLRARSRGKPQATTVTRGQEPALPPGLTQVIARAVSAFQALDIPARMPVRVGKSVVAAVRRRRPSSIFEVVSKPGAGSQLTGRSVSLRARGLDFSTHAHGFCGRRLPPVIQGRCARCWPRRRTTRRSSRRSRAGSGRHGVLCLVRAGAYRPSRTVR
jgi:hypothetical protein